MPTPCLFGLLAGWLLLAPALSAAEYEQRHGSAVVRLQGVQVEDGRITARLADEIVLTMTVEGDHPLVFDKSDKEIQEEQIRALEATGAWLRCEGQTERTPTADGRERWRLTLRLDPLRNGEVNVQPLPLSYTEGPGKRPHRIEWQPMPLTITTEIVQPDLKELRDIPPPEELPPVRPWWLPWLAGLVVVLASAALVLGGWELKRRLTRPEPPPAPHQWALSEMERIEALGLPAAGQAERYHTLLSDVLRRYFELRYRLPASHQTTAEFLAAARSLPGLTAAQQEQLRQFLERCDLAKFARAEPTLEECQAAASLARALVEQTTAAADGE
ncbi:MAG TPA: hypothetical protein VNK04_18080 [Gemmataceae bacterium]|nr:hypothetical protein [Gemmataceae bacterium]